MRLREGCSEASPAQAAALRASEDLAKGRRILDRATIERVQPFGHLAEALYKQVQRLNLLLLRAAVLLDSALMIQDAHASRGVVMKIRWVPLCGSDDSQLNQDEGEPFHVLHVAFEVLLGGEDGHLARKSTSINAVNNVGTVIRHLVQQVTCLVAVLLPGWL